MKVTDSSYIYNIKGLFIPKGSNVNKIAVLVDEYVSTIPELAESLNGNLFSGDIIHYQKNLESILFLLDQLKAKWLQNEAELILKAANKGHLDLCRKHTPIFVADLFTLSIEMQMAKEDNKEEETTKDETTKDEIKIQEIENAKADSGKKILLVDDRPEILESVSGLLKDKYKVFGLTTGTFALKFLEKQTPDLFILDIDMPDMDGLTLAKTIRNMPAYTYTPILFLTSTATRDYVVKAMDSGGDDFIVKPARRNILRRKVSKFLT